MAESYQSVPSWEVFIILMKIPSVQGMMYLRIYCCERNDTGSSSQERMPLMKEGPVVFQPSASPEQNSWTTAG
jgi:hypothetical protein